MKIVHTEFIAVLQCRITSAGHVNHILLHILADNKPRSSTQPQSFTLADGMKPIARCLPNFLPVSNSTISPSLSPRKRAQNHYNQSFPESRCPDCHDVWRWAIRHAGLCHEPHSSSVCPMETSVWKLADNLSVPESRSGLSRNRQRYRAMSFHPSTP